MCDTLLPHCCCSTAQTASGVYGQAAYGAAQGATTAGGGVYAQQQAGAGYASQPQQQAQAQVIAGDGETTGTERWWRKRSACVSRGLLCEWLRGDVKRTHVCGILSWGGWLWETPRGGFKHITAADLCFTLCMLTLLLLHAALWQAGFGPAGGQQQAAGYGQQAAAGPGGAAASYAGQAVVTSSTYGSSRDAAPGASTAYATQAASSPYGSAQGGGYGSQVWREGKEGWETRGARAHMCSAQRGLGSNAGSAMHVLCAHASSRQHFPMPMLCWLGVV